MDVDGLFCGSYIFMLSVLEVCTTQRILCGSYRFMLSVLKVCTIQCSFVGLTHLCCQSLRCASLRVLLWVL